MTREVSGGPQPEKPAAASYSATSLRWTFARSPEAGNPCYVERMTVLLGFTSPANKMSFMGGDDIEMANGTPQNKVEPLFDQFLVGCVGENTIFGSVEIFNSVDKDTVFLDGTKYTAPTTSEELCNQIRQILPIIAKNTRAGLDLAIKKKIFSEEWGERIKEAKAKLFIIDGHNFDIHLADFGHLYYSEDYSYSLQKLTTERAFRFGLDYPFKIVSRVTDEIIREPYRWGGQKMDEAREEVKRQDEVKHFARIGKLGARYVATPEGIKGERVPLPPNRQPRRAQGPFVSLEDVAQKLFPDPATVDPNSLSPV